MSSKNDNKRTFSETQLPIVPELKKIKVTSKSNFFTPTIIDRYVSSILLEPNKTIMNIDQLFEYFGRSDRSPLDIANQLKIGIPKEAICSGIYLKYLEQVLERSIETNGTYINYDIAFIIDISIPKSIEEIEKAIIALIIVQRNECPKFANAYVLNLICSRKCFSCGNILMGLYLYTILSHPKITDSPLKLKDIIQVSDLHSEYFGPPILHMGLLELSGGYTNITALCLYTKFGFIINPSLSGPGTNCFIDDRNIAMIKRFKSNETEKNDDILVNIIKDGYDVETEKEKILQIVRKEEPGYKKHLICEFKDKQIQKILAGLYNKIKDIQTQYAKLVLQSKFPINKNGNEFTKEFKDKIDPVKSDLDNFQEQIDRIESSSRDITFDELFPNGGKARGYKTKKITRKLKTKKRRKHYKRGTKHFKRH
jgi:hypothetical protein